MEEVEKVDYVTFGLFYGISSVIMAAIFLVISFISGATFLPLPILAAISSSNTYSFDNSFCSRIYKWLNSSASV